MALGLAKVVRGGIGGDRAKAKASLGYRRPPKLPVTSLSPGCLHSVRSSLPYNLAFLSLSHQVLLPLVIHL